MDHLVARSRIEADRDEGDAHAAPRVPGKRTLTERLGGIDPEMLALLRRAAGMPALPSEAAGPGPREPIALPPPVSNLAAVFGSHRATSGGQALPEAVQRKMEASFGADFSDVRMHQDGAAAAIGARAFARGNQVHFAPGMYDPESEGGQRLIGHELAHVVQQRAGVAAGVQGKGMAVDLDPALEAEADRAGDLAALGQPAGMAGGGAGAPGADILQGDFLSGVRALLEQLFGMIAHALGLAAPAPEARQIAPAPDDAAANTPAPDDPATNAPALDDPATNAPAPDDPAPTASSSSTAPARPRPPSQPQRKPRPDASRSTRSYDENNNNNAGRRAVFEPGGFDLTSDVEPYAKPPRAPAPRSVPHPSAPVPAPVPALVAPPPAIAGAPIVAAPAAAPGAAPAPAPPLPPVMVVPAPAVWRQPAARLAAYAAAYNRIQGQLARVLDPHNLAPFSAPPGDKFNSNLMELEYLAAALDDPAVYLQIGMMDARHLKAALYRHGLVDRANQLTKEAMDNDKRALGLAGRESLQYGADAVLWRPGDARAVQHKSTIHVDPLAEIFERDHLVHVPFEDQVAGGARQHGGWTAAGGRRAHRPGDGWEGSQPEYPPPGASRIINLDLPNTPRPGDLEPYRQVIARVMGQTIEGYALGRFVDEIRINWQPPGPPTVMHRPAGGWPPPTP